MNKSELSSVSWQGFVRQDGRLGIRNKILVIFTVECASFVASKIVQKIDNPDVEVIGFRGCTDNEYAVRMLIAMIRHPNVGGVLAVGLGCEYVQAERLAEIAKKEGKEAGWFFIQDAGGTVPSIEKGVKIVTSMMDKLQDTPVKPMHFSDLVIGGECGGSDYTSGLAGNVVVGRFNDFLVDQGGCALFEEIVEAIGLVDQLSSRAANPQAKKEIESTYYKALEYCKSVRQYSISPGNFAGGLSTIEEKSMGAIVKSGSRPIQGVLKVSECPPKSGLWLLDSTPDPYWMQFGITNPNDNEGLMDLISCGSHIVFLVTGRGNVVGSAVAPCVKVTGNSVTYKRMEGDMDFDAGPILAGTQTIDSMAEQLASFVKDVASGKRTKSEALGHKEFYIPYKYQDKHVKTGECRCSI